MNNIIGGYFDDLTNPDAEVGFNNGPKYEPSNNFVYNEAICEKVFQGQNNSFIVFGRDRLGPWSHGYGGKGHDKAGAIDIVVGRLSNADATKFQGKKINASTGADAARIYLSQKADIDEYFQLAPGRTAPAESIAKSAIAIKADDVRLISRNTFKIVTGTDVKLSNGNTALLKTGVQLIANNTNEPLQPIPKGDNLIEAFNDLLKRFSELNGIVTNLMKIQKDFNYALGSHIHISPFYGLPTSVSAEANTASIKAALQMQLKIEQGSRFFTGNLKSFKTKYLCLGDKYINSSFHFSQLR